MEAEVVSKIAQLAERASNAERREIEIGGRSYTTVDLKPVYLPAPKTLEVTTLQALTDYLNANPDSLPLGTLIIHIEDPASVKVYSPLQGDFMQRPLYLKAAPKLPSFNFGNKYDLESFKIALLAKFVATDTQRALVESLYGVTDEQTRTFTDDGIGTTFEARVGVRCQNVQVKNPVLLRPFRTFPEVEQPESGFIFRTHDGPALSLTECDGGAWALEAVENIRQWLADHLEGITILA